MNINGWKTYAIGVATLLYAIGGAIIGEVDVNAAITLGLAALGGMGLRHSIK